MNILRYITCMVFSAATLMAESTITLESTETAGQYVLKVEGTLNDCPAMLVRESLNGKIATTPAYVREDGILARRYQGYPTFVLDLNDIGPGEPVTLSVLSCDRTRSCAKMPDYPTLKFFPRPLKTENADGISLSAEIFDSEGQVFLVKMEGLLPGENVSFNGKQDETADVDGKIEFYFNPSDEGIKATNSRMNLSL